MQQLYFKTFWLFSFVVKAPLSIYSDIYVRNIWTMLSLLNLNENHVKKIISIFLLLLFIIIVLTLFSS